MIQLIHNLKIKYKLIIIIMATVIFSLLLVGAVLIFSERYILKQSMADKLMTVSQIIADGSTAALSFDNVEDAAEVLSALRNESSVILGCIYNASQTQFAVYHKTANEASCPVSPKNDGYSFQRNVFELYEAVLLEDERIGTVYVRASLDKLNEHLLQFILLVVSMIILAGIITYVLANKVQTIISGPILKLADFARKVSLEGDYSHRVPRGFNDEIGILNLAFNDMLEQIEQRQLARDTAEQALTEREKDLRVTLNSIGDAVIATDVNGNVTRMNPVAEILTGWSFTDAEAMPLKTIFPIVNASTREVIENPVDKVIKTGETVFLSNHTTLIAKDGEERQIADSAAPIRNEDNSILGMILVFNDVTEKYRLRESAAKSKRLLQAIMDNSPAVIYVKDTQGRFLFINQKFEQLFNLHSSTIIDKSVFDIFPEEIARDMYDNEQSVISIRQALEFEEIVPQDNVIHTYSSIKFPLINEDNEVYAVCGISSDITERQEQEKQLRRSQKMDALGKLTGGIAHDYNNLLGIIMGYAELLDEKLKNDPQLAKYAQDIEHAAERGTKLTRKLLAFTRHKSSDARVLDINALLQEQRLMLEKTLTARIVLHLELCDNIWPVWLDSGDLEDAVINMSINASHAMAGRGNLTLRTSNEHITREDALLLHLEVGDYVLLSITDTGCGMDEATRERIFDPFFSTKGEQGNGLGLSQVYGFIKRSGGQIKVYSELQHGSRFAIYFPRSRKTAIDKELSSDAQLTEQNLQGNETLLVVDDEPALLELARDILTARGYHVLTAADSADALNILQKKSIDMLITDVIMPEMDGYQLAERVLEDFPQIKILMASGFADGRHLSSSNNDLHLHMIYKPYTSKSLLIQVRRLLGKKSQMVESAVTDKSESVASETAPGVDMPVVRTILIMDDELDVRELFAMVLETLGYRTLLAANSSEALEIYQHAPTAIDALIVDLNIPGSLGGVELAAQLRTRNSQSKIIVSSGDSSCAEMLRYQDFGFDGALEKNFDRKVIKALLDKVFA